MVKRGVVPALVLVGLPSVSLAQGVLIDHKPVGCIVAGKYPKLNACFNPASKVANAKAYFQSGDPNSPHWYYVAMKSDAPCFSGVLPKVRKNYMRRMNYYLEVTDLSATPTRTSQFEPGVVQTESECRKEVPVAPFLNNATVSAVAVGAAPAAPIGFVGTGLALGTPLIVGGAVVVAGGTAAAISLTGDDRPTTTAPGVTVPPTVPPVTVPPTAPPVTDPPRAPDPPFVPAFSVRPQAGRDPLNVTLDMCASTGLNLRYTFDFESDGIEDLRGPCSTSRVYFGGAPGPAPATTLTPTIYTARLCVRDDRFPRECRDFTIIVNPNTPFRIEAVGQAPAVRRLAWSSLLDVEGGAGQVVVNGEAAAFAGKGRSTAVAMGRRGDNRVEAILVQGAGQAGTWRFDLGSTGSLVKGSLRVVAGEVVQVTADALVFRVKGQPGERLVFTFKTGN
jgi:hypothetical protein